MKMELFADVVPKTAENMRWASYIHVSFYHQKNSIHVDKLVVFDAQINIEGPITVYYNKKKTCTDSLPLKHTIFV